MARELKLKDTSEARRVALRMLKETIPARWKLYLLSVICVIGVAVFTSALAYSTRLIVNEVFVADDTSAAWRVALLVIGVSAGKSLFQYANSVISVMFSRTVTNTYQQRLFRRMVAMDVTFFAGKQAASQMAQLKVMGQASAKVVVGTSIRSLMELLTLVGLGAVMVFQDPVMSLAALVLFPLILFMVGDLSRRVRAVAQAESDLTGAYFAVGSETFAGIKTVKSYGLEEKSISRFDEAVRKLEQRLLGIAKITSATVPMMEFLGGLVIGAFVVYASWQTVTQGKTPGEYTAFITAFLMAYQPAERLSKEWVEIQKSLIHCSRMLDVIDAPIREPAHGGISLAGLAPSIRFDDVVFAYKQQPALQNVTFDIAPGEKIAIVGRSGAGKTTLIDLVQGFYQPTSGTVSIAGHDLRDVASDSIRETIALISQDVFLFEGTIRENIRDGDPQASDAEIEEAARRAQVMTFADTMPKGLDTPVGPNGAFLSGGQRQRIGIARALAKHARIYIFDEATSALDGMTERAVMEEVFATADKEAVFLFVTHRPSTLAYIDRVMLLDRGQLVAFAPHDEMTSTNDTYRTLFNLAIHEDDETDSC